MGHFLIDTSYRAEECNFSYRTRHVTYNSEEGFCHDFNFVHCSFIDCEHKNDGGAIRIINSTARVNIDSVFINQCVSRSRGGGGFLHCLTFTFKALCVVNCMCMNDGSCVVLSNRQKSFMNETTLTRCQNLIFQNSTHDNTMKYSSWRYYSTIHLNAGPLGTRGINVSANKGSICFNCFKPYYSHTTGYFMEYCTLENNTQNAMFYWRCYWKQSLEQSNVVANQSPLGKGLVFGHYYGEAVCIDTAFTQNYFEALGTEGKIRDSSQCLVIKDCCFSGNNFTWKGNGLMCMTTHRLNHLDMFLCENRGATNAFSNGVELDGVFIRNCYRMQVVGTPLKLNAAWFLVLFHFL